MAFFAAMHYWLPKIYGRMYDKTVATVAWGTIFVGFCTLYISMKIVGMMGMPRRYWDYLPEFTGWNQAATVGSWILGAGLVLWIWLTSRKKTLPSTSATRSRLSGDRKA